MFGCLMPREDHIHEAGKPVEREYTLYHAKYTILDSCKTPEKAKKVLDKLKNSDYEYFVKQYRELWESDFIRFYPGFRDRFEFVGVDTGIASKFKTETDFRTAVTFKKDGQIYVFSGKINNVFDAAKEVGMFINAHDSELFCDQGYFYLKMGEFARSKTEINTKPQKGVVNTAMLHTIHEIRKLAFLRPPKINQNPRKTSPG